MARRPWNVLLPSADQTIFILAPSRDLLTLPLPLTEMDSREIRRRRGSLAVFRDFDRLSCQGMLGCDGRQSFEEKKNMSMPRPRKVSISPICEPILNRIRHFLNPDNLSSKRIMGIDIFGEDLAKEGPVLSVESNAVCCDRVADCKVIDRIWCRHCRGWECRCRWKR